MTSRLQVVAIHASNDGTSDAGILLDASSSTDYVSDATWKCSNVYEVDWTNPNFDDSNWPEAVVIGNN